MTQNSFRLITSKEQKSDGKAERERDIYRRRGKDTRYGATWRSVRSAERIQRSQATSTRQLHWRLMICHTSNLYWTACENLICYVIKLYLTWHQFCAGQRDGRMFNEIEKERKRERSRNRE